MSAANSRRVSSDAQRGRLRPLLKSTGRVACWVGAAALMVSVSGCGLFAWPCRVTAATLKVVPGIGGVAAAPFDTCASAID
jgi:hypothetical protein